MRFTPVTGRRRNPPAHAPSDLAINALLLEIVTRLDRIEQNLEELRLAVPQRSESQKPPPPATKARVRVPQWL